MREVQEVLSTTGARGGVSRRTVAKGVAWTVPAVMVAGAAPAFAISGTPPTFVFDSACKSPGNSCKPTPKGYTTGYNVCNTESVPIYLYSVTYQNVVSATKGAITFTYIGPPTMPVRLEANTCYRIAFAADSSDSGNLGATTGTIVVRWGHTLPGGSDTDHGPVLQDFNFNGTPPDCCCPANADCPSVSPL